MFIIWGSKGKKSTIGKGQFFCPSCRAMRPYEHVKVGKYFTLYFVPLFETKNLGEYVECQVCSNAFKPEVLSLSRQLEQEIHQQDEVAKLVGSVAEDLDSGVPLQAVALGMKEAGVDAKAAAMLLYQASGAQIRTCGPCGLSFKGTVAFCSTCGSQLGPLETYS